MAYEIKSVDRYPMEFLMRSNITVFAYLDDLFHSNSDELYKSYERTNQ